MTVFAVVLDGWRWTLRESGCAAWTDHLGREVRAAVVHGQAIHRVSRARQESVRLVDRVLDVAPVGLPAEVVARATDALRVMRRAA